MNTGRRVYGWLAATIVLLAVIAAATRVLTWTDNGQPNGKPLAGDTIKNASNALAKLFNGAFGY